MDFCHDKIYSNLREIRVVTIQSDKPGTVIRCSVEHQTIDQEYCCLSYTCGDSTSPKTIFVNGKSFSVRQNLWNFLDTARRYGFSRKIWIDAISINQSDEDEKSRQVAFMGKIYASAASVIMWLGIEDDDVEVLRKVQNLILHGDMDVYSREIDPTEQWSAAKRRSCFDRHEFYQMCSKYESIEQRLQQSGEDLRNSPELQRRLASLEDTIDLHPTFRTPFNRRLSKKERGLFSIISHPALIRVHLCTYWTRVWIVQEIALAKSIEILGPSHNIDFLVIEPFLAWHLPHCGPGGRSMMDTDRNLYNYPRLSMEKECNDAESPTQQPAMFDDFSRVLGINEWRSCSIKRDRLYALLSLTSFDHRITVDYAAKDEQIMWEVFAFQWHKHKDKLMRGVDLNEGTKEKFHREQGLLGSILVKVNEVFQPLIWKRQILEALCRVQEFSDTLIAIFYCMELNPGEADKKVYCLADIYQQLVEQPHCAFWCRDCIEPAKLLTGLLKFDQSDHFKDVRALCFPVPEFQQELLIVIPVIEFTSGNWNIAPGCGRVMRYIRGQWIVLSDHSISPLEEGKTKR